MSLPAAQPAEIVRASQKDDFYRNTLSGAMSTMLGPRNADFARPASSFLYGACTTLRDLQTLGEEYSGIVQVDDNYNALPVVRNRLLSLIFATWGEDMVRKILSITEKAVAAKTDLTPTAQNAAIMLLKAFAEMLPQIERIHRALCYIYGGPLAISKAVTGINYVQIRPAANGYYAHLRLLGLVTIVHALASCVQCLQRSVRHQDRMNDSNDDGDGGTTCVACLSRLGDACVLPCGHIFCFNCCYGPLQACALCRTHFVKSTVVPLQNFHADSYYVK